MFYPTPENENKTVVGPISLDLTEAPSITEEEVWNFIICSSVNGS